MRKEKGKRERPISRVEVRAVVIDYHRRACQIPPQWDHMIVEIVVAHMQALDLALGNLELAVRRTLDHPTETRKEMKR